MFFQKTRHITTEKGSKDSNKETFLIQNCSHNTPKGSLAYNNFWSKRRNRGTLLASHNFHMCQRNLILVLSRSFCTYGSCFLPSSALIKTEDWPNVPAAAESFSTLSYSSSPFLLMAKETFLQYDLYDLLYMI